MSATKGKTRSKTKDPKAATESTGVGVDPNTDGAQEGSPESPGQPTATGNPQNSATPMDPDRLLNIMGDVPFTVSVEMGRTQMPLREVMTLREGSVIELNKSEHDPLDLCVNNRHIAKGEIVALGDRIGIRITALVKSKQGETQ